MYSIGAGPAICIVILQYFITFPYAGASVWTDNKDCHLCGIKPENHDEDDGISESKLVVNGKAATTENKAKKYPWMVIIYYKKNRFLCTGALISSKYILTAAHCLTKGDKSDSGEMDPEKLSVELRSGEKINVSRVYINDDFKLTDTKFEHDIGLMKLKHEPKCNKSAYPICVPDKDLERIGEKLRIAGYGHEKNKERKKPITDVKLRKGAIKQVDSKLCKKAGPNTGPKKSILCAVSEDTKQISCEGDSGSPVFWRFDKVYYVLGVSSSISGEGECVAEAKSTYSKVYYYKKWIKNIVGKFPKSYVISQDE